MNSGEHPIGLSGSVIFILQRESTGIAKLDEVIGGGLPRPSITALIGAPGVGTTSLCKKFIVSSLLRGRRVLVALGDEPPHHYLRHFHSVKSFDTNSYIDQRKLFLVDSYADFLEALGIHDFGDLPSFDGAPIDEMMLATRKSVAEQVQGDVKGFNIVTDSVTSFSPFIGLRDAHRVILGAQAVATENNHVMVCTAHEGALEGNLTQVIRQYADGVIRMRTRWVRGKLRREMIIEKMRFTEIKQPVLSYEITDEGVEII